MLIDTHCHLDFPDFDQDRDAVLARALEAGVGAIINVGSGLAESRAAVALARKHDNVFAGVGIHPHDSKDATPEALAEIEDLLSSKKVVAIGEVGLDYYRNLSEPKIQREVFKAFIGLAVLKDLPLVVHSRQAEQETLAVLGEFKTRLPRVVIHCFSGDEDFLKECLGRGFFISFTCNVTYKKAGALREIVKLTPLERMFLETDAPFLSPEGKRGKRNEPAYLVALAEEVGRVKQMDFEEVCRATTENARRFFGIE